MRIALNMLFVGSGLAGGRVYCEGLLRGLASVADEHEYVVFTRRGVVLPLLPPRFTQFEAPVSPHGNLGRTLWEFTRLPVHIKRLGCHLVHGLGGLSPRGKNCPLVLTVHDLIYHHFPESVPLGPRLFLRWMLPRLARRADIIITPSHNTARDVVTILGVPSDRIRVIAEGPGQVFERIHDLERIQPVLAKHGIRLPYILSVCRAYPHKNLAGLLLAFACLDRRDVQLVLVGDRPTQVSELNYLASALRLGQNVLFTGFLPKSDLDALYSAASVFAFPSLIEGFGLPVLEAMASGAPVVASNLTSIPEVAGDAALLTDQRDPAAFAALLEQVLDSVDLQETLRQRGLARARTFSWERAGRQTVETYQLLG
jgi:glycosyltransferase involved in cell wall biosynthesis